MLGIVTKFDFLRAFAFTTSQIVPHFDELMRRTVADVMTEAVVHVEPAAPLTRVLQLMVGLKSRSFPVIGSDGQLVGMISARRCYARPQGDNTGRSPLAKPKSILCVPKNSSLRITSGPFGYCRGSLYQRSTWLVHDTSNGVGRSRLETCCLCYRSSTGMSRWIWTRTRLRPSLSRGGAVREAMSISQRPPIPMHSLSDAPTFQRWAPAIFAPSPRCGEAEPIAHNDLCFRRISTFCRRRRSNIDTDASPRLPWALPPNGTPRPTDRRSSALARKRH